MNILYQTVKSAALLGEWESQACTLFVGRQSTQRSCKHICRQLDWRRPIWQSLAVVKVEYRAVSRQCLRRHTCLSLVWMMLLELHCLTSLRFGQAAHSKYPQLRTLARQHSPLLMLYHWPQSTGKQPVMNAVDVCCGWWLLQLLWVVTVCQLQQYKV